MSERVSKISKTSPLRTLKQAIYFGRVSDVITLLDTSKNLDATFDNNYPIRLGFKKWTFESSQATSQRL